MSRMTTQERLECLLKLIDELSDRQGAGVIFSEDDAARLTDMCGFKDSQEIAFYMDYMEREGLLKTIKNRRSPQQVIGAQILIPGYKLLDDLRRD